MTICLKDESRKCMTAWIFDLGPRIKELKRFSFPERRVFSYRLCTCVYILYFFSDACISMEDSEYLSYDGRTWFSRKSATYISVDGGSIFNLLFSYIIISCFLKGLMSAVWLQTTSAVLIYDNEATICHLNTASDGISRFLERVLSLCYFLSSDLLLIMRRLYLLLPNFSHIHIS